MQLVHLSDGEPALLIGQDPEGNAVVAHFAKVTTFAPADLGLAEGSGELVQYDQAQTPEPADDTEHGDERKQGDDAKSAWPSTAQTTPA